MVNGHDAALALNAATPLALAQSLSAQSSTNSSAGCSSASTSAPGQHQGHHNGHQQHHNGAVNGAAALEQQTSQRSSVASRSGSSQSSVAQSSSQNSGANANAMAPGCRGATNGHQVSPKRQSPTCSLGNGSLGNGSVNGDINESLIVIKMKPDSQGRFGFNVKGGADQNYPIIVSKVAAGSSADTCYPRLNEGDQVLRINGRDVSVLTHDQVVQFIRSAREPHTGHLVLTVRPNCYAADNAIELADALAAGQCNGGGPEPDFQYVPDTPHRGEGADRSDMLRQSLLLLRDALTSGAALIAFDRLYRKNPSMTMNACRMPENVAKNRYRDIAPYDNTRVIIANSAATGDYINANFVNMEIAKTGVVNRYIAAQGPLPHTANHFWQVVWEQLCTTVVMLTTTVERGRVKCHQYWPRLYETAHFGHFAVTCVRETESPSTAYREFSIVNSETSEERQVGHMQYMAWPDHGVPDDPHQFIEFVADVRRARLGSLEPLLVHCSAGIGRTGVLILMETAMCLIEANEPVYPLDCTKIMRDQRAMLIQNSGQYRFVCEAILKAYEEGIVAPLEEYCNR